MNLKRILILFLLIIFFVNNSKCFAKLWGVEETYKPPQPTCTPTGTIGCSKGFKPKCPEDYEPMCVFVGTKQLPACLAKSTDQLAFNYYLDKISCAKEKENKLGKKN